MRLTVTLTETSLILTMQGKYCTVMYSIYTALLKINEVLVRVTVSLILTVVYSIYPAVLKSMRFL
jgi:hypothetical protein